MEPLNGKKTRPPQDDPLDDARAEPSIDAVASRSDVRRWIARLKRLSREMPPCVKVRVSEGGIVRVCALDEHGRSHTRETWDSVAGSKVHLDTEESVLATVVGARWETCGDR